jgi:predicted nucleotidyltransferase
MKLEHKTPEEIKKVVTQIIQKHTQKPYRLFFFGSRVIGRGDDRSDIDIGIETEQRMDAYTLMHIREELEELPILYKIDLVHTQDMSEEFKKVALQHTEPF